MDTKTPEQTPETWAVGQLVKRIEDAADHLTRTYSRAQALDRSGRELLAEHVPATLSLRDYPAGSEDDFQGLADAAYEAARSRWASGGDGHEMCNAAWKAAANLRQELAA